MYLIEFENEPFLNFKNTLKVIFNIFFSEVKFSNELTNFNHLHIRYWKFKCNNDENDHQKRRQKFND